MAGRKAAVLTGCDRESNLATNPEFLITESAPDCPMHSAVNSKKKTEKQIFMHCIKGGFVCKFTAGIAIERD